jgi:AcrB/AcrD/AcrF family
MNISEVFIRRPIATTLLMGGIFLFGLVSYELLPVAALPNVDFPTIVVTAQLPGANPTTMSETVATPLENQFTQIPGLAQMTSTSGLGQTTITLQFDLSVDINAAASQVQQEIQAASGLLPKNMPTPPTYRNTNPADRPILIYAVHSDAMPVYQVDAYANAVLAQSLSTFCADRYGPRQRHARSPKRQPRRSATASDARYERSAGKRQPVWQRHRGLPERSTHYPQRHRRGNQLFSKHAHWCLV